MFSGQIRGRSPKHYLIIGRWRIIDPATWQPLNIHAVKEWYFFRGAIHRRTAQSLARKIASPLIFCPLLFITSHKSA